MRVKIGKGTARGIVQAPPSKSMAHRLLICAGLADGTSVIHGIATSEDVLATIDCLQALGIRCELEKDTAVVYGRKLNELCRDTAADEKTEERQKQENLVRTLRCRESGSTLRFFIPICLAAGGKTAFCGSGRLMERPQSVYRKICEEQQILFRQDETGILTEGKLKAGNFSLAGDISSQFISGLLFALPQLETDSTIQIQPPVESRSYIEMTLSALAAFGIEAGWKDENVLYVKGGQKFMPQELAVEGDYSNAAFFEALNVIGGQVSIGNLNENSLQGDRVYRRLFEDLKQKKKTEINISDCPDLGPILFAVAAAVGGGTFSGCKRLKIKESNRGEVMASELKKFGVKVHVGEDEVDVEGTCIHPPETILDGHNDHRIVMSCAVLLTLTGGEIQGAEAVTKSFPDFFEKLTSLGIEVTKIED